MTTEKDTYNFSRSSQSGKPGFEPFAEGGFFYFHVNGSDGQPILFSPPYKTATERNNGMCTVGDNSRQPERYAVKEGEGGFQIVLKKANRREIARSPAYASRDEADKHLRTLLYVLSGKTEKLRPKNGAKTDEVSLSPEPLDTPRHYFDLKFYPDGQGVIQYPLTQELLRFRGLDGRAIIEFVQSKLTPSPAKNPIPSIIVNEPLPKPLIEDVSLEISLPFSLLSSVDIARKRKIEVGVHWKKSKAEAVQSAFFYLKSLKSGQIITLNNQNILHCPTTNGENGTAQITLPDLPIGLYRLMATTTGSAKHDVNQSVGQLFQVI